MKVSFFATCLVDQLFPQVGVDAVRLLEKLGLSVDFDSRQTCCGQPAFNSGLVKEARKVALSLIKIYRDSEYIVVPSGSCATMLKSYLPGLYPAGSAEAEAAGRISNRVFELSDFIVSVLGLTETGAHFEESVTFHDSCHQLRELRIKEQPRLLIRAVKGINFIEMNDSERCCGFGGTFAVKFPELSSAMGSEKADRILETGAKWVVANDVSCLMHLDGLAKRKKLPFQTMHLAELLMK